MDQFRVWYRAPYGALIQKQVRWCLPTKSFLEECNVDDGQGEGDCKDDQSEPEEDNLVLHVVEVDRLVM